MNLTIIQGGHFTVFTGLIFKAEGGGRIARLFRYRKEMLHMERLTRNRKLFNTEMGAAFKIFRTKVLKVTLKDIGGQSLIPSLSNFENGKLFRYEYMYFYIMACQDERQLHKLEYLVNQIMYNAWKRGGKL